LLKARLIANKFRRQVSAAEVRGWINDLAEIAVREHGVKPGRISRWIAEETGYSDITVRIYLEDKYKIMTAPKGTKSGYETKTISTMVSEVKSKLSPTEFEAVKEVAKAEVKQEVVAEVKARVKEELRQDPDFVAEVASEKAKTAITDMADLEQEKIAMEDIAKKAKSKLSLGEFEAVKGWTGRTGWTPPGR